MCTLNQWYYRVYFIKSEICFMVRIWFYLFGNVPGLASPLWALSLHYGGKKPAFKGIKDTPLIGHDCYNPLTHPHIMYDNEFPLIPPHCRSTVGRASHFAPWFIKTESSKSGERESQETWMSESVSTWKKKQRKKKMFEHDKDARIAWPWPRD